MKRKEWDKMSFHTTQYDLNSILGCKMKRCSICFHTTQYDLNSISFFSSSVMLFCFHTTQYDLNSFNFFTVEALTSLFPYYIVRFKLSQYRNIAYPASGFHTTQYDLNPILKSRRNLHIIRFHTTQYDLNSVILFFLHFIISFPYYIVRFKHGKRGHVLSQEASVSILHSTI